MLELEAWFLQGSSLLSPRSSLERGHICVIFNCFICFYLFHQGGRREEIFVLAGRGVQLAGIGTAPGIVTAEVFFIANIVLYS